MTTTFTAIKAKYDRKAREYRIEVVENADLNLAHYGYLVFQDAAYALDRIGRGSLIGSWKPAQRDAAVAWLRAKIDPPAPAVQAKSIEQLQAEEKARHAEYERTTTGTVLADGRAVTIAELRAAFSAVEDEGDWKRPFSSPVRRGRLEVTVEAVKFFHGYDPRVTTAGEFCVVHSAGYQG